MKLSLEIVKEYLEMPDNSNAFYSASNKLTLERPVIYTGEGDLESDTFYICTGRDLSNVTDIGINTVCICCGNPPKRVLHKLGGYLIVSEEMDMHVLANRVQLIFNRFDHWTDELYSVSRITQFRQMLQQMLEISSDIFENGISIMDSNFHIIVQTKTNIQYGGYDNLKPSPENVIVPDEIVSVLKYDERYHQITQKRESFYFDGEMIPHRLLCKNLFQNEKYLFRIMLTECIRPFRKTDEILLDYLSEHILYSLQQYSPQSFFFNDGIIQLLSETLVTGKSNRLAINSELHKLSWLDSDEYRVASVHVSPFDLYISSLDYYSGEIARLFSNAVAFPFQDRIVLVINETKSGQLEKHADSLRVFIRENNFRIGISNYSNSIYNIQTMDRQAEMALTIGMTEKPMEWIHWFSKYTLQYIYNMLASNSELGQLYSPVYYQLERYDKENETAYLETLKVYLRCNRNVVHAANELYIQRSTMNYRLKRIREITDNDLDDPEEILLLNLTFSIINREQKNRQRLERGAD